MSAFYEYTPEIRKIIYTKNKPSFTNDDSPRRTLYLASRRITRRWRTRFQNWDLVLSQPRLMFAGRAAS